MSAIIWSFHRRQKKVEQSLSQLILILEVLEHKQEGKETSLTGERQQYADKRTAYFNTTPVKVEG